MNKRTHHYWTQAEREFLIANWNNFSNKQIADKLGVTVHSAKKQARELNLVKTKETISAILKEKPNPGQFQKGGMPHNTRFDQCISIRIDRRGHRYQWIRLGVGNWQMLHIYNWLKAGKAYNPKDGDVLKFIDGNSMNADVSNLKLITRNTLLKINKKPRMTAEERKQHKKDLQVKYKRLVKESRKERARLVNEDKLRLSEERRLQKQEQKRLLDLQKEAKKKSAAANRQWQSQRAQNSRREKRFEIKSDFSTMIPVKVDYKTTIYIKQGEDPEQAKVKYLERIHRTKTVA